MGENVTKRINTIAYLWTDTRKLTMVTISTKMSIVLHLARKSNHKRMEPRRSTDKVDGETNQSARVINVLVYGQMKENMNISIASSSPPARVVKKRKEREKLKS